MKATTEIQPGTEARAIERELQVLARRHDLWTVWADWVEMQALAISNAVDLRQRDPREVRYLEIVKRYERPELDALVHCAAIVRMALERNPWQDFLGRLFMLLELGNKWSGQFFTPYEICRLIAQMQTGDLPADPPCGFSTACDPCVGGGAMLIGFCQSVFDRFGEEWPSRLHVTGQDVDLKAVHMSYVQLSLIGAPAVLIHGNTLTLEERSVWYTPAHVLGLWSHKLKRRQRLEQQPVPEPAELSVA